VAKRKSNFNIINKRLSTIKDLMGSIYKSTYGSTPELSDSVDNISQEIEDNISAIVSRNNMDSVSGVAKLYTRLKIGQIDGNGDLTKKVSDVLTDTSSINGILSMYMENRWIKDLDLEYETILRYMPRLKEAMKAKKENVLSSDNFSNDFINVSPVGVTDKTDLSMFAARNSELEELYDLQRFYEKSYDKAAMGECFVYCVPYSKAIKTLLMNKSKTTPGRVFGNNLHGVSRESSVQEITIIENGVISSDIATYEMVEKIISDKEKHHICEVSDILPNNFKVIIDNRGFLESAFNERGDAETFISNSPSTVLESYGTYSESKIPIDTQTVPDQLEVPKDFNYKTSHDGLILKDDGDVRVQGAVLKILDKENIIPLYLNDTCLGYYYLEFNNGSSYDLLTSNDHVLGRDMIGFTGIQPQGRNFANAAIENSRDQLLSRIAWNISSRIDSKFINKNQDLVKDIYEILKYNDLANAQALSSIRITFIPPDDVEHLFFEQDEKTHRGISDLAYALIPAKLYSCLYITNTLGHLTRGHDKRVYYVKQNVETNIAQTMVNVINQIKKGNFGLREIENMNSILNITGRFNDFVIPVGPSGDSPIQFEVMPGQDFQSDNELMDRLEEMSINSTGMPIEYIQNRMNSIDFAVQATTVNLKVLRSSYTRQRIFGKFMTRIQRRLYKYQYGDDLDMRCMLPPPIVASAVSMNDIINNVRQSVEAIASYEYDGSTDPDAEAKKAIFIKIEMRKRLAAYVQEDDIKNSIDAAELEFAKTKKNEE